MTTKMSRPLPVLYRLAETLMENRIPTFGFLTSFPEAFGLPSTGSPMKHNSVDLQKKVDLLVNSGSESRKALSVWRDLEEQYFAQAHNIPLAVESASLALRQTVLIEDEDAIDLGDLEKDSPSSPQEMQKEAEDTLSCIASRVSQAAPAGLFEPQRTQEERQAPEVEQAKQREQLSHLSKVVHGELKYRQEPYEWVYDGLNPLLLDSVLKSREGIHISLAALYCALGRRLGCSILPEIVPLGDGSRAAIDAGLSLATAPTPNPCLLRIDSGTRARSGFYLEPTTGRVLDLEKAANLFHGLRQTPRPTPIKFWRELLRVAVTAHQRRGDGDAVAHCMHQLLALDLGAAEWASALRPAAIQR